MNEFLCEKLKMHFVFSVSFPVMTPGGQRLTVLSKPLMGLSTANKVVGSVVTTTTNAGGRVGMRVPPLNVNTSPGQNLTAQQQAQLQQPQQLRCGIVARTPQKEAVKAQIKEQPKSEFYLVITHNKHIKYFND